MKKRQKPRSVRRKQLVPGVKFSPHLPPIVLKALRYIEKDLTSITSTRDISDAVGVSREHLSRVFSQQVGVKIWAFVNRAKVERAKEMLADKSRLVKQIYPELGFGCQSTFYNVFREYVGMTPSRFRTVKLRRKKKRR